MYHFHERIFFNVILTNLISNFLIIIYLHNLR